MLAGITSGTEISSFLLNESLATRKIQRLGVGWSQTKERHSGGFRGSGGNPAFPDSSHKVTRARQWL